MVLPGFPKKTPNGQFYGRQGDVLRATWGYRRGAPLGATGGLPGQRPTQGGDLKIFEKKFLFPLFRPLTTTDRQGAPVPELSPKVSPLGGTVWELGPPENVIFVDYNWRILRIAKTNFRVTSHVDSVSPAAFSAIFGMGVRRSEYPRNRPRRNPRFFAPTFDPLGVPPQKFWLWPNL